MLVGLYITSYSFLNFISKKYKLTGRFIMTLKRLTLLLSGVVWSKAINDNGSSFYDCKYANGREFSMTQ